MRRSGRVVCHTAGTSGRAGVGSPSFTSRSRTPSARTPSDLDGPRTDHGGPCAHTAPCAHRTHETASGRASPRHAVDPRAAERVEVRHDGDHRHQAERSRTGGVRRPAWDGSASTRKGHRAAVAASAAPPRGLHVTARTSVFAGTLGTIPGSPPTRSGRPRALARRSRRTSRASASSPAASSTSSPARDPARRTLATASSTGATRPRSPRCRRAAFGGLRRRRSWGWFPGSLITTDRASGPGWLGRCRPPVRLAAFAPAPP